MGAAAPRRVGRCACCFIDIATFRSTHATALIALVRNRPDSASHVSERRAILRSRCGQGHARGQIMKATLALNTSATATRAVVDQFMKAWAERDLDRGLALMADDAVFISTTGPDPGRAYKGLSTIRPLFASLLSPSSTIQLRTEHIYVDRDTAIVLWTTFDSAAQREQA